MPEKLYMKSFERNGKGSLLEVILRDPEMKEEIRFVRTDDVHGDEKNVRIKLTDGSKISGIVNMGKYTRVSDLFAYGKRFQVICNATTDGCEGRILFVNKEQIVWAEEVEEKDSMAGMKWKDVK